MQSPSRIEDTMFVVSIRGGRPFGSFHVTFHHEANYKLVMRQLDTPLKINMEHNHGGLVQMIFLFFSWVMAVGSSRSSSRVYLENA